MEIGPEMAKKLLNLIYRNFRTFKIILHVQKRKNQN